MKLVHLVMTASVACGAAAPALALIDCAEGLPVVTPAANLGECIATDALAGKSLIDIAKDCGTDLITVVVAIVNAVDPGVLGTKAHSEAVGLKMALEKDGGR